MCHRSPTVALSLALCQLRRLPAAAPEIAQTVGIDTRTLDTVGIDNG
jgi:hypothetical protein